jgi:CRP/FNR family transcriptional regulator, cyclic AMP receptor protein
MISAFRHPADPRPRRTGQPAPSPATDSGGYFWSELSQAEQADLRRWGSISKFRRGTTMIHENDHSTDVMMLLTGCVKVVAADVEEHQTVLGIRDSGEIVGEMSGISGRPRSASVCALADVEALIVPLGWFNAFVRNHIEAAVALQCSLCARLRDSDRVRRAAMIEPVERRLATVLLDLAGRYGRPAASGGVLIDLPLSHGDLAGLALTSRRTIDRVLTRLRSDRVIVTGRHRLVVHNPAGLRALVT